MKITTKYILGLIAILAVIIACTKEVGLYTEVEFEISETHVANGFINTPLATSITVTPEELVEGYSYSFSYKINTGEGYFQDETGNTIPEGDKIGLNPLSATLNYIATKIGDHSITFTAEDTFGFQEQVTASYTISDVPVSWTATGPTGQVLLGTSQDISVTLGNETTATGVTYERNYSFTEGTGTITSSPRGTSETLNEFVSITPGAYALEYVSTELGQTTLEFLLKDSNGQEIVQTVSFEVVDELSTEKEITSFIVNGVVGTISGTTIDVVLPEGTDVTALAPVITHTGASISPESETSQDFSNPVIYTVAAQDQTIQEYTVTLTVEGNEAKDITDFAIDGVDGIITGTNISVTLPAGTDVTSLSSTVTHTGASVNPTSGVAQDFTSPVEYTVTAADGTTKVYTVTVSLAPALSSDNNITSFSIDGVAGVISGTTITVTLPAGTDVSSLTPAIIHTGNTVNPDTGIAQDFTNPITYTVTAANLDTQEYSVTVIMPTLSDTKDITSFSIDGVAGVISGTTITVTLPAGTDVSSLTPAINDNGNTVNPNTGVAQDFTNPVEYTVTAADTTTKTYTVTAIISAAVNIDPVAIDDNFTVIENSPNNTLDVLDNDSDPDGTVLTIVALETPINGSATIAPGGQSILYTATTGNDRFDYTIEDEDGATTMGTIDVNVVPNENPTVEIDDLILIPNGNFPKTISFAVANSNDTDGTIENYEWNFGDPSSTGNIINNTDSNATSHTFNSAGTYNIVLTVTDNLGATGSDTVRITLEEPLAPDFTFTANTYQPQPIDGHTKGGPIELYFSINPNAALDGGNYIMTMETGKATLKINGSTYREVINIPMTTTPVIGPFTDLLFNNEVTVTFRVIEMISGIEKTRTLFFTYCDGLCP
ncbi:PKD domain containing protein [Cellulophaga algicola DSM 14237]|uniref:PKD domain containing protein n=1 Tax=Cellulophaga algicola (strain DSM 14237 / IC166 / ACAM 630) TaxID=688270 RepID=E6XAP6_CELAD|nr:PKD domain-containing protein [Cellulophaga algicola]ADV51008.1 PKD domain containing protein [Cellulophaga algicola DSM 14237]